MSIVIANATSRADVARCYPVLAELRPHLREAEFCDTIQRLADTSGFRLACLVDGDVRAVAGYRVSAWLHTGKYLEIEDLVTRGSDRSRGYGGQLFDWLVAQARDEGCRQLRLVSGVKRVDAHRFYLRKGMVHEAHYFSLGLQAPEGGR